MFTIEYLEKEHEVIIKLTNRIEEESINILDGKDLDVDFFRNVVSFIREFADSEHHKKEEDILFKYMLENLGPVAEKLIRNGMLVEHDMARHYVMELEKAIDEYEKNKESKYKLYIITNSMSYADLLRRHVDKENNVVYTFADRSLKEDIKEKIELEMKEKVEEEKVNTNRKNLLLEKLNIK